MSVGELIWIGTNYVTMDTNDVVTNTIPHTARYINNISSGKALPSMSEFFAICDYFEITPQNFFNCECKYPELIQKATAELSHLEEDDILMLLTFITRLSRK